jgi:frataxin-like iron-binding protein CyaY
MENKEIWKHLKRFDNYKVSNYGNVLNIKTGKLLKKGLSGRNIEKGICYYRVTLFDNKKSKTILVHVLVAECFLNHKPDGTNKKVVDHIDKNKLNNNSNNLRILTNRENLSMYENKTSKYTGVHFHSKNKKWNANIWHNKKKVFLGTFEKEIEAHFAYQKYLKEKVLC